MKSMISNFFKEKHLINFVVFGLLAILLNACYTQKDKSLLQDTSTLPEYSSVSYSEYKIKPNDELIFRVVSTDQDFINLIDAGNMNQQQMISYRVYPDGTIDLPFIDSLRVGGMTLLEASESIKTRFKRLVNDAEVRLTLANKHYTVIGEAGTGIFPLYKEQLNIYQALAQSGEIALTGDRKHVKIIREQNGVPEILEFDIRPNSVVKSKYYYIYPNDIIYVQRDPASFYKANSYGSFIGLVSSSIALFTTVYYYTEFRK